MLERFRGRGAGSKLMDLFEARCREKGIKEIWFLSTGPALPFYEQRGYRPDDSFVHDDIKEHVRTHKSCTFMRKIL